jgi:hypothetical protein
MKHFLILALVSIAVLAQAQDFAPIGARWIYDSRGGYIEKYQFTSLKDTVILGKASRKIERVFYEKTPNWNNSEFVERFDTLNPFFIHQDIDSIFLFDPDKMEFDKIYVFNVKKGDTITLDVPFESDTPTNEYKTFRVEIDSVASENADAVQFKKYRSKPLDNFSYGYGGWYLDKVGSLDWFIPRPNGGIMEIPGPLLCYIDSQFNYPVGVNCETITSNAKGQLQLGSVYPNPTKDKIWIKSTLKIDKVEIYSIQGSLLGTSFSEEINTSNLNSGQYLLKIYSGNDFVVKPIIVE